MTVCGCGWLALSAEGDPIPFFGLHLPPLMAQSEALKETIKDIHETGGTVGYFLIGLSAVDIDVQPGGEEVVANVFFRKAFEGPPGRAHGGMIAAAFDDVGGPSVIIAIACAIMAGLANGILISIFRLNAIVATIGVNALLYGAVFAVSGGVPKTTTDLLAAIAGGRAFGRDAGQGRAREGSQDRKSVV